MSKTKEEILDEHLGAYLLKVSDISHGTHAIPKAIRDAMSEYAKQESIEFAEWVELNGYRIKGMDDGQRQKVYELFQKQKQ